MKPLLKILLKINRVVIGMMLIALIILISPVFGKQNAKDIISLIDRGFTTRWDIEQKLGKGEYLENEILSPPVERYFGQKSEVHYNGLLYKEKGILFICSDDGELIDGIFFLPPFKGLFSFEKEIEIGRSSISSIIPYFDTLKYSTTIASNYYSFYIDSYSFYIEKHEEDKTFGSLKDVPKLKNRLYYYSQQPIKKATIYLYIYDLYVNEKITNGFNGYLQKPNYSPKSMKHLNSYSMSFSDSLDLIEKFFFGMLGGQRTKIIKNGYWIEYWPSHKLKYEGTYVDNLKIGVFKYYDINGKLINRIDYKRKSLSYKYYFICFCIFLILYIKIKKKEIKKLNKYFL